jgi:hypothetical protein
MRRGVEHQELEEEDDQAQGQACVGKRERLRENHNTSFSSGFALFIVYYAHLLNLQ